MPAARSSNRLEAVQILRAVAAILVVLVHAINANDFRIDLPRAWLGKAGHFNSFGASGVDMFFVLSGFVMAHALLSPAATSAGRFASQRLIRVVPYYWLASLAFLIVMTMTGRNFEPSAFVTTLTVFPVYDPQRFLQPVLFVGWTLAFELAFYLVVSLAIWLAPRPQHRLPLVLLIVCTLGSRGWMQVPRTDLFAVWLNPIWYEFGLGLAVHWVWERKAKPAGPLVASALIAAGMFGLGFSAVSGFPFTADHWAILNERTGGERVLWWALPAAGILLGLLWLSEGRFGTWLAGSRGWRAMLKVGDASYSLYLLHVGVLFLYEDLAPTNQVDPDLVIAALLLISILVALAAYHWVEQPLLRAMRGITFGKRQPVNEPMLPRPASY